MKQSNRGRQLSHPRLVERLAQLGAVLGRVVIQYVEVNVKRPCYGPYMFLAGAVVALRGVAYR